MKRRLITIFILFLVGFNITYTNFYFPSKINHGPRPQKILQLGDNICKPGTYKQSDIPTIFVPGILASWYSEQGFKENSVKRWIPDPITHAYDPLFYTFAQNGYIIKDVFYKSESKIEIKGTPKSGFYAFGYDWKKDNVFTATLLNRLVSQIREKYISEEGCDIGSVNIVAHSMGGLVARAMLQDMCISDNDMHYYENQQESVNGELKKFNLIDCPDTTNINQFITIATPHRGSPRALPLWEKGGLSQIETFSVAMPLKLQFGEISDSEMYQIIHGYDDKVKTGMVGIGQLLPDIKNETSYNKRLQYLFKDNVKNKSTLSNSGKFYINHNLYPQNSFLENLNKEENIKKMWKRINKKYTSYFSIITGNTGKNNITEFHIGDTYFEYFDYLDRPQKKLEQIDNTQNMSQGDIKDIYSHYEKYNKREKKYFYQILHQIRKSNGLGGDGTVPTYNLLLTENDTQVDSQISHPKFHPQETKCYQNKNLTGENPVYRNMGRSKFSLFSQQNYKICSHSYMPSATAIQVYGKISGNDLRIDKLGEVSKITERELILKHLGYAEYKVFLKQKNNSGAGSLSQNNQEYTISDIGNHIELHQTFTDKYYKRNISDEDVEKDKENPIYASIEGGSGLKKADRTFFRYEVLSPINLLITDSQGRRIGIDPDTGLIVNEIPGAWTSGDTEGSGEPEFFLIPGSGNGAVEHSIETFGTGDGEYHIVVDDLENGTKMVIAGEAKEVFGENYKVQISETGSGTFENLTASLPAEVHFDQDEYVTNQDDFTLRYSLRGNAKHIEKVKYILSQNGKKISEKTLNITGKIELKNLKDGEYSIGIEALDKNGKKLSNSEATKIITLVKVPDRTTKSTVVSDTNISNNTSFLSEKVIQTYKKERFLYQKESQDIFPEIELKLYNNSGSLGFGKQSLGVNLHHNYDNSLWSDEDKKSVEVWMADGTIEHFLRQDDFSYSGSLDSGGELQLRNNKFEVYYPKDKKTYIFDDDTFLLEEIMQTPLSSQRRGAGGEGGIQEIKDQIQTTSTKLFYNSDTTLNYITDFENNSLFFSYTKTGIQIRDRFGNTGEMKNKNSLFDLFTYTPTKNINFSEINYILGQDKTTYSFLKNKVYKLPSPRGEGLGVRSQSKESGVRSKSEESGVRSQSRKRIINSSHQIQSVFIDTAGNIYYKTPENIYKYDILTKKASLFAQNNHNFSDFIVQDNIIYFLDTFQKGYFSQEKNTKKIYHWNSENLYSNISIDNKEILFQEDFDKKNDFSENPELIKKKQKIISKITLLSQRQRSKLKAAIERQEPGLIKKIKNLYTKALIEELLGYIKENL